jgi:hypothetical protein
MAYAIQQQAPFARSYSAGVSIAGACLLVYAVILILTAPLEANWLLLSAVTILAVSRIRFRIPGKTGDVTLSGTFYFVSFLLYGLMPAVALAAADAGISSLFHKDKRKLAPFKMSVAGISMFFSGGLVNLLLAPPDYLKADMGTLGAAAGLLALGYCAIHSAMFSVGAEFVTAWKEGFLWASAPWEQ